MEAKADFRSKTGRSDSRKTAGGLSGRKRAAAVGRDQNCEGSEIPGAPSGPETCARPGIRSRSARRSGRYPGRAVSDEMLARPGSAIRRVTGPERRPRWNRRRRMTLLDGGCRKASSRDVPGRRRRLSATEAKTRKGGFSKRRSGNVRRPAAGRPDAAEPARAEGTENLVGGACSGLCPANLEPDAGDRQADDAA